MQPRRIAELLIHLGEAPKSPKSDKRCRSGASSVPRRIDELRQAMCASSPLKVHSANDRAQLRTPIILTKHASPLNVKRQLQFSPGAKLHRARENVETYLRKDCFKAIVDRGWHKMTTKEFLSIVNHFLPYTGVDQIQWQNGNYVEQMMKSLKQLNYPHNVNKSWLSMPNAPSNLNNAMQLLDFLIDFAPIAGLTAKFDFTENSVDEKAFDLSAKYYGMWLMGLRQQICDEMVHELSALRDVKALDDELSENRKLQLCLGNLRQELKQNEATDKHELQQLQAAEAALKTELANCKNKLKTLSEDSCRHEQKLGQLCTQLWRQGLLREALQQNVNQQTGNKEKQQAVLNARHAELSVRRRELRDQDELVNKQSLLLKLKREQLSNRIEAYNVHMQNLCYASESTSVECYKALKLPLKPTLEEVTQRRGMLQDLCNGFLSKCQLLHLQAAIDSVSLHVLCLNIVQEQPQQQQSCSKWLDQQISMRFEISQLNQKVAELQLQQDELSKKLL